MTFWTWALAAYARPGAAEACLDLQDRFGQCVPYLLWAAWAAGEGRALNSETLQAGAELSERWQAAAVAPLREARRAMKPSVAGIDEAARATLRAEVKALELKAEQVLIETLEGLASEESSVRRPLGSALAEAARAWPSSAPENVPESALARLAHTLS